MALSDTSKTLISIKKLVGKAHTSNDKDVANEALPSGITISSNTVFGQTVPAYTGSAAKYEILTNKENEKVGEFLRLSASFVVGSDTSSGRHGFSLKLPDDYETHSTNPKRGTDPFVNGRVIYLTTGSLQLIPTSYDSNYEAKPYHTGSGETQIPVLDARDWSLDYFNGILFQQDPSGTGDQSDNPRYIDAYLYIGKMASEVIASASSAAGSSKTLVFNEKLSGTANGSNSLFTLAHTPFATAEVSIFVNGQLQTPPGIHTFQDYSVTGSNVFFTTGAIPAMDSLVLAIYNKSG